MKVIYIAGPYRAKTPWQVQQNIEGAAILAAWCWQAGFAALCPHMNSAHMEGCATDEAFLEGTLELMRRCDAVLLHPDWRRSEGARAERAEAERLGIPVFEKTVDLAAYRWDAWPFAPRDVDGGRVGFYAEIDDEVRAYELLADEDGVYARSRVGLLDGVEDLAGFFAGGVYKSLEGYRRGDVRSFDEVVALVRRAP